MFEGISFGSYVPGQSLLHNLDPRTKILGTLLLITGSLIAGSMYLYLVYSFVAVVLFIISGVSWKKFLRDIKFIYILLVLSFLFQSFAAPGEVIMWEAGRFNITLEGVKSALIICWRLAVIVVISSLLTYTTTSISLSAGLEKILKPMERIGISSSQLAMMMGISLSFIPVMLNEFKTVMIAQQSRGARFGDKNLLRQFKNILPLLLPVIIGIFRRADELSEAMEARCYRPGANRTRMNELYFTGKDWSALGISFSLLFFTVLFKYGGNFF